jgi:hypothetical protein
MVLSIVSKHSDSSLRTYMIQSAEEINDPSALKSPKH